MALNSIDWIVIIAYLAMNLLISLYYRRRSSGSTEEFFVSGRNVSWWLAGTSMVATTFAADTPLFVTGVVARNGIAGNWIWWSQCLSGMMTVFFFARYWRRAGILTDVEFVELRYEGKAAAFLRGFRAIYLGGLMNCLILGWVIKAMISITTVLLGDAIAQGRVLQIGIGGHNLFSYTLGEPAHTGLLICVLLLVPFTGIYTFIGGLWGVLVTDLFQFILKMSMIIVLAWVAVTKVGGMTQLKIQLSHVNRLAAQSGQTTGSVTSFFPSFNLGWTTDALWTLPVITLVLYLGVQWWASWYPGAEPGGGGYVAQRMFSAKDEKNSLGATLWFNIANYAMRSWPWVVTGLVAVAVYSPLGGLHPSAEFAAEPEKGYVMVLRRFPAPSSAGPDGGRLPGCLHVHSGYATELGYFLFHQRLLPPLHRPQRHRKTLRLCQQTVHRLVGDPERIHRCAHHLDSIRVAASAGNGRGDRWRADAPMVLVAGERLERDFRDDRRVRRVGVTAKCGVFREQFGGLCEICADHHGCNDRGMAGDNITHAPGVRRATPEVLSPGATYRTRLEAHRRPRSRNQAGSRLRRQHLRLDHGLHAGVLLHVRNRRTGAAVIPYRRVPAGRRSDCGVSNLLEPLASRLVHVLGRHGIRYADAVRVGLALRTCQLRHIATNEKGRRSLSALQ